MNLAFILQRRRNYDSAQEANQRALDIYTAALPVGAVASLAAAVSSPTAPTAALESAAPAEAPAAAHPSEASEGAATAGALLPASPSGSPEVSPKPPKGTPKQNLLAGSPFLAPAMSLSPKKTAALVSPFAPPAATKRPTPKLMLAIAIPAGPRVGELGNNGTGSVTLHLAAGALNNMANVG